MKTIALTGGGQTIVDDADHEWLSLYRWHGLKSGKNLYASRMTLIGGKWKRILMHRVIAGVPDGMHVDHRNDDTLDNQRHNLRWATRSQNMGNARKPIGKSGYRGVQQIGKKWVATFRSKHISWHSCPIEAAHVYDNAARLAYGNFARVNFPLPGEQGCREVA